MDENNWDQNDFGAKSARLGKFGKKKNLKSKTFWSKILSLNKLGLENFGGKKSFLSKNVWFIKILGLKQILAQKVLSPKRFGV